jgi:tetratricopeptide (TPR) repeat protein
MWKAISIGYPKSRVWSTTGYLSLRRGVPLAVLVVLAVFFAADGFMARAYREEREVLAARNYQQGEMLAQEGRISEAIEHYDAALALSKENMQYRLALILALVKEQRTSEALAHLTDLLQTNPTSGIANLMMARIETSRNAFAEAETYYQRAIYGSWPNGGEAHRFQARLELVDLLEAHGDKRDVLAQLLQLQDELPNDEAMEKQVADLFLKAGSLSYAADDYRRALHKNPKDLEAHAGLGRVDFAQRNYAAAQAEFREAIRLNPKDAESQRLLDLTSEVLSLDPMARRLSTADRYHRSRKLVELALAAAEQCSSEKGGSPSAPLKKLQEAARKSLAQKIPSRRYSDATEADITLAEHLWHSRQDLCGEAGGVEEPLGLVIAKLSQ